MFDIGRDMRGCEEAWVGSFWTIRVVDGFGANHKAVQFYLWLEAKGNESPSHYSPAGPVSTGEVVSSVKR